MKKKSQMEIMGMAIIVILVVLILIFVLRFVITKQPAEYKKEYQESQLANNILSTLLKTNAPECSRLSFSELYQDCAENWAGSLETSGQQLCGALTSCQYIKQKTGEILENTLSTWNKGYELTSFTEQETLFSLGQKCQREKKSKTYYLHVPQGTLNIKLDICSG